MGTGGGASAYQVSTAGALVEGVYQGAVSVGTVREHGDFGLGTFEDLDGSNPCVLSFLREFTDDDGHVQTVLCVHNLSRHPQPVQLNLARRFHNHVPIELTGGTEFPQIGLEFRGGVGDALAWDNVLPDGAVDPRTLHAGRPPTQGMKYLLSKWMRSRSQRGREA